MAKDGSVQEDQSTDDTDLKRVVSGQWSVVGGQWGVRLATDHWSLSTKVCVICVICGFNFFCYDVLSHSWLPLSLRHSRPRYAK